MAPTRSTQALPSRRVELLAPATTWQHRRHDRLRRRRRRLSPDFPLGLELEVFIRREDAERFIEEVRGDDPELASYLRIEERELEVGGLN